MPMHDQIKKDRVNQLLEQMRELYDGDLWYGTTIMPVLKQVDAEESVMAPLKGVHSIQQLVLHMTAWRGILLKRLEGNMDFRIEVNSADDWKPQESLSPDAWEEILRDFQNSYLTMLNMLEQKAASLLDKNVGDAGYDFQYLIEGILHHDIYHLGQIALVRKILRVRKVA